MPPLTLADHDRLRDAAAFLGTAHAAIVDAAGKMHDLPEEARAVLRPLVEQIHRELDPVDRALVYEEMRPRFERLTVTIDNSARWRGGKRNG